MSAARCLLQIGFLKGVCWVYKQGLDALDPEERLDLSPEFVGASAPRHAQGPYTCAHAPDKTSCADTSTRPCMLVDLCWAQGNSDTGGM